MALAAGTRLGPYEVNAQIGVGVGGMGEVYRATDPNLKRQIAIKVLPASARAWVQATTQEQKVQILSLLARR